MKTQLRILGFSFLIMFITFSAMSQTTAMDFNRKDCNGVNRHLFADLDSGKAVIIEYFMTSCAPCINAGTVLESMKANLLTQYPGKIKSYAIGFNNTYSCSVINNWVNSNAFTAIPMDSGAAQVAYYGGFGMPSIVILGDGSAHNILGSPYLSFVKSDTTTMVAWIRNSLNVLAGVKENSGSMKQITVYPNPVTSEFNVSFILEENAFIRMEVLDISGRVVKNLLSEKLPSGGYVRTFREPDLASGNYFLRINTNGVITQRKLNIIN